MYIHTNSSPTVTNCTFSGNTADYGGAMYNFGTSSPTVTNCIFSGNTAATMGGGIYNDNNCSPTVTNCTFSGNSASSGGGMANRVSSSPTVTNSILWADSPSEIYNSGSSPIVTYSDIQGGYTGTGNINADPLFVGGGDYHLTAGSPCIDTGTSSGAPATDLEGSPRPLGAGYDMGAYEFADFYVDDDNCPGPGTGTQADPFCTIQSGINAAFSGDTVLVAAGTYYENITMKSGVVIQGAGQGVSIIDGGGSGSVVTAISVDSAAMLDGFTITGGLSDFGGGMYIYNNSSPTVTNCTFSGNSANDHGGGMYIHTNSSPTVTNCTFSGNTASSGVGGGMYNDSSSPTVESCTFLENSASSGGGIFNMSSVPTVTNCTFSGNTADVYGGGMFNENSSPTVINCTFSGNTAASNGGGMFNENSSPTVTNCTFSGNTAALWGGGMYNRSSSPTVTNCTFLENSASYGGGMHNRDNSSPTVTNCTFSANSATTDGGGMYNQINSSSPTVTNCTFSGNIAASNGGGMYNYDNSSPTVNNSILWGDSPDEIYNNNASPSVTYSDIQGGYTGTGNINADPLFVDPDGPDNIPGNEDDDYHLMAGSPCIDAGDNSAQSLPSTDFEGDDRKIDDPTVTDTGNGTPPIVDMGADELDPLVADFTAAPTSGEEPLSVDFTDQSIGTITSWDWAFGDGATSTEKNPSHTYQDAGTFTVSLTISGPRGTDTETKIDLINVEPLDSDDDGLPDDLEDTTCSDSLDADSDDDGIFGWRGRCKQEWPGGSR